MTYIYVTYVDISWPPIFITWFKWTGIANLAVLDLAPIDCMQVEKGSRVDFYQRHTVEALLLPGICLLFAGIYLSGLFLLRRYFSNKMLVQAAVRLVLLARIKDS